MSKTPSEPIILANWGRRFIAWFIDYLFINIMLAYFGLQEYETKSLPSFLLPSLWSPLSILVLFLYWTLSEWYFGRSIGQLLLNLRLADLNGNGVSLAASAIQSIGKAIDFPLLLSIAWSGGLIHPAGRLGSGSSTNCLILLSYTLVNR